MQVPSRWTSISPAVFKIFKWWDTAGLRQGGRIFLCGLVAAGIWSLVLLLIRRGIARQRFTYLVFYLYRSALGGSVEPYYLEARDGKEASFCLAPCLFLGVIGAELIRYL